MSIRMIPGTSLPKEFVSWLKEGRARWLLRIVVLSGAASAILMVAIGFASFMQPHGHGLYVPIWAVTCFYLGIGYAFFYTPWVYGQVVDEIEEGK